MVSSRQHHTSRSNLPRSIIHKISKNLKTRDQILRFKRVCKKWRMRSVLTPVNTLSLTLPLNIPISTTSETPPFHDHARPLVLQVNSIYVITPFTSSLKPWMVMVQESNSGKLRLRHPLTAKRCKKFPPTLDLTRFRVTELSQGWNFKYSDCVHKVLLCPSTSPSSSIDVLVLYKEGILGKLTVRVLDQAQNNDESDSDSKDVETTRYCWKNLKVRENRQYWFHYLDDIIEFKGMYCGVDRRGRLYVLDTEAMRVAKVLVSEPVDKGEMQRKRRKRLVVEPTSGKLHLVVRENTTAKARFKVYKFNNKHKQWNVVEDLGKETVLFVGVDHTFFGKVNDFPGCKGNCIVFSANCFTQYCGRNAPDGRLFSDADVGVGVYRLGKGDNFRLLSSAYPDFSKLIWPPPTWFSCKSECSNDEDTESDSSSQEVSDEENSNNMKSLSGNHAEGMLTDSSGDSSSDKDKDEHMQLDSSTQNSSKGHESNGTIDSGEGEEENTDTSFSNEQPNATESNFSDKVRSASPENCNPQPAVKNDVYFGPPLAVEYEEHNKGTSKMNNIKKEGLGQDF